MYIVHAIRVHLAHNNEYNIVRCIYYYYYYKTEQSATVVAVVFWRNYYTVAVGGRWYFWRWPFSQECCWRAVVVFYRSAMSRTCNVNVITNIVFDMILLLLFMRTDVVLNSVVIGGGWWRFVDPLKMPINIIKTVW